MKSSVIYTVVTVAAVLGSVCIVVAKKIPQEELNLLLTKGVVPESILRGKVARGGGKRITKSADGTEVVEASAPLERTDEELKKVIASLPVLHEIPWSGPEIAQLFANRSARPCRLIPPDEPVEIPLVSAITSPSEGTQSGPASSPPGSQLSLTPGQPAPMPPADGSGLAVDGVANSASPVRNSPSEVPEALPLFSSSTGNEKLIGQRSTAFRVGLVVDSRARATLPSLSKATIENYLDQHSLAIQPEIFRSQNGEFLMTGDVHAAFFAKNRPSVTGNPDPMIRDAISSFRVLGVLPPTNPQGETSEALPRTLVMAFSYKRDKDLSNTLSLGPKEEFELLFLHLLPQSRPGALPAMAVFATSDGCSTFQELDLTPRAEPELMASIRFGSYNMKVMPADPVVTGIANRVRSSITVQELRNRIALKGGSSATSLELVLDEIHGGQAPSQISLKP